MKRFAVLLHGLETGIAVTAVTAEQALAKLNESFSVRATVWKDLTFREEGPRCTATGIPLPRSGNLPHKHQVGTVGRKCKLKGCTRGHYAKGWCRKHYLQAYTGQVPGPVRPYRKQS